MALNCSNYRPTVSSGTIFNLNKKLKRYKVEWHLSSTLKGLEF